MVMSLTHVPVDVLRRVRSTTLALFDTLRSITSNPLFRLLSGSTVSTTGVDEDIDVRILAGIANTTIIYTEMRHLDSQILRYRLGETRAPRVQVYANHGQPPVPSGATWELIRRDESVLASGVCSIVDGYTATAAISLTERGYFTLRFTISVGVETLKPEYQVEVS
jgi:hypothetical protein